ncbi:MAG: glycosyltransferase family 4 protein [Lachnospiraceae bacterium]|nr:glycosyltransferase family 4 protein [Lachnospiraceae bacterium]
MFNLNFKKNYKVVHVNNELGNYLIGGAGTYMNEIYKYRPDDMGFIYMNLCNPFEDYEVKGFLEQKDILVMHKDECSKLNSLACEILVVQFYEFAFMLTEELVKGKKIAYVVHSVPTPEPPPAHDPFGGNDDIRDKFYKLCEMSNIVICVSNAEKEKLAKIYPQFESKVKVVHNGITYDKNIVLSDNYKNSRKIFGYIGRADYRKGILECIREFKNVDGELRIACPKNDESYVKMIIDYIEAADMQDRVKLYGWCVGKRKEQFLKSLDALIIPSLYEPFGYVALEGIQYGLPVISSKNGGLDEIFEGYKYKYNPYKKSELKDMIEQFQNDSDAEIHKQQQILLKNIERFSAEEMCRKYNKIWDELLNN